jgi:hypothetical protein
VVVIKDVMKSSEVNVLSVRCEHTWARSKFSELLSVVGAEKFDKTLILIGERLTGPFTILDGNHRTAAVFLGIHDQRFSVHEIPAYIGVSTKMRQCIWYSGDAVL